MQHLPPNSNKLFAYDGTTRLCRNRADELITERTPEMAMRLPAMKDITTVVAKQSKQRCETVKCSENETLQRYYGQIGIPAVAAAVRCQGDSKNPVYAPVRIKYAFRKS
jgi:hypothetical protein